MLLRCAPALLMITTTLGCQAPSTPPAADVSARVATKQAPPPVDSQPIQLQADVPATTAAVRPVDPGWFRADLFAGATVIRQGHTRPDEEGQVAAQITLQLAEGATRDQCVATLQAAVIGDFTPELEEKDGRIYLRGSTDRYTATLLCGEAKGRMTAFLSWRGPAAP
jgi:hypothetical protein